MENQDESSNQARDKPTIYSVPRRFDLATLLVVTVAFSVLFAGLTAIQTQPEVFLVIVGFFVVIGLSQAIFAPMPRLASVLSGAGYFVAGLIVFAVVRQTPPGRLLHVATILWVACFAIQGAICGYFGGTLIGGVFLVADYFRRRMQRPTVSDQQAP